MTPEELAAKIRFEIDTVKDLRMVGSGLSGDDLVTLSKYSDETGQLIEPLSNDNCLIRLENKATKFLNSEIESFTEKMKGKIITEEEMSYVTAFEVTVPVQELRELSKAISLNGLKWRDRILVTTGVALILGGLAVTIGPGVLMIYVTADLFNVLLLLALLQFGGGSILLALTMRGKKVNKIQLTSLSRAQELLQIAGLDTRFTVKQDFGNYVLRLEARSQS